jgi:hypothetical protein
MSLGMNVGGSYGGSSDRTFTGGTTDYVTVASGSPGGLFLDNISGIDQGDGTTDLTIQFGYANAANKDNPSLRGLVIAAVPEPGTYALALGLLAFAGILIRRRVRQ